MKYQIIFIRPRIRDIGCLCLLSFIIFSSVTITFLVSAFTYNSSMRGAGTVEATLDVTQYGFGTHRRLVVLNISEIGGVSNIDDYDKKNASMTQMKKQLVQMPLQSIKYVVMYLIYTPLVLKA